MKRRRNRAGFTLVELLVVITIIVITTAVAIPAILPALTSRRVSEAARVVQAQLVAGRDEAVRSDGPRGVRLLASPDFPGPSYRDATGAILSTPTYAPLAYNRMVSLDSPRDHTDGLITVMPNMGWQGVTANAAIPTPEFPPILHDYLEGTTIVGNNARVLVVFEQKYHTLPVTVPGGTTFICVPNAPTNWYGNIRQGDRLYIPTLKRYYSIAGPVPAYIRGRPNTERFVGVDGNAPFPNLPPAFAARYDRTAYPNVTPPLPAITVPTDGPFPAWPPPPAAAGVDWSSGVYASMRYPEYLIVTNEVDDGTVNGLADPDELIDEHFDGQDNNFDGYTDQGFDGLPFGAIGNPADQPAEYLVGTPFSEWENDDPLGLQDLADPNPLALGVPRAHEYRIVRRPVPALGSSEVTLPGDVFIDATTDQRAYHSALAADGRVIAIPSATQIGTSSRSRLPIGREPSYNVDFQFSPNGMILQAVASAMQAPPMDLPFLHFWLTEREDIATPYFDATGLLRLPVAKEYSTGSDANYPSGVYLTKGRRLVSVTTKTGQIVTNAIEIFDPVNVNTPFAAPQRGIRDIP